MSNRLKTSLVILGTLLIAYAMANLEVVRRAHGAYQRGEEAFAQKNYKEALWSYQEVQEFYYLPKTHWVDLSAEKEFICRAYLGDWVPPEGPMEADVRVTRAAEYERYKSEVAQITPVGDTTYAPAPPTDIEKKGIQGKITATEKKKK